MNFKPSDWLSQQAVVLIRAIIENKDPQKALQILKNPSYHTPTLLIYRIRYVLPKFSQAKPCPEKIWLERMITQITRHFQECPEQLQSIDQGGPSATEETNTEHTIVNTDYSNQPVAKPTLVYGTDVKSMSEPQVLSAIKSIKDQMKETEALGITGSRRIDELQAGRLEALSALFVRLDEFATTPAPATA